MAKPKKSNNRYTWARAVRDIVVSAINKGQLPILGIIAIFLVILWRMPANDLSVILKSIIDHLVKGELWVYPILALTCGGWFTHAKKIRANATYETNRMCEEKTRLQNLLTKKNFKSSE